MSETTLDPNTKLRAEHYPELAISRARAEAKEWLEERADGYPRSWEQEDRETLRRGYHLYDGYDAPPIAGYDVLEREGLAIRVGIVINSHGQERVHFRLVRNPVA